MKFPLCFPVVSLCSAMFFSGCDRPPAAVAPSPSPKATPQPLTETATAPAPAASPLAPIKDSPKTVLIKRKVIPSPIAEDSRLDPAGKWGVTEIETKVVAPPAVASFREWLSRYVAADSEARRALEAEGRSLLESRRKEMADLIATDPEAAILLSASPEERAGLPPDMQERLERVISGEGFYGVLAICSHGAEGEHGANCRIERRVDINGENFLTFIYGNRRMRMTEEQASIYGVALDGKLALHEDDVILRVEGSRGVLVYKGREQEVNSENSEQQLLSLIGR